MQLVREKEQPRYRGLKWSNTQLPDLGEPWVQSDARLVIGDYRDPEEAKLAELRSYADAKPWVWPDERICFLCDIHADADAFLLSLQASGGVVRTGPGEFDFELTEIGKQSLFILGGDCFDKGPSNLRLLRCLNHFRSLKPRLQILAGNHDLRTLLGIDYAGRKEAKFAHLFVRMGKKTMRLFKEVFDEYVAPNPPASYLPDDEVRRRLFPDDDWYEAFPKTVQGFIPTPKIKKEVKRIREKVVELAEQCQADGMSLGMLHATLEKCRKLFLDPGGEFRWYFEEMALAYRSGSFLFVHAGVDDAVAECLASTGCEGLNRWYHELLGADLFELYHGPVGNVFRTKYRDIDFPMTDAGRRALQRAGIYAIVHGHRNILRGARVTLRAGIMNFECDASVDINTRRIEGLPGQGGSAVVFEPSGRVFAVSTDYPFVRVLEQSKILPGCFLRDAAG